MNTHHLYTILRSFWLRPTHYLEVTTHSICITHITRQRGIYHAQTIIKKQYDKPLCNQTVLYRPMIIRTVLDHAIAVGLRRKGSLIVSMPSMTHGQPGLVQLLCLLQQLSLATYTITSQAFFSDAKGDDIRTIHTAPCLLAPSPKLTLSTITTKLWSIFLTGITIMLLMGSMYVWMQYGALPASTKPFSTSTQQPPCNAHVLACILCAATPNTTCTKVSSNSASTTLTWKSSNFDALCTSISRLRYLLPQHTLNVPRPHVSLRGTPTYRCCITICQGLQDMTKGI